MNLVARIKPFTRLSSSFPPSSQSQKQLFYPRSIQRCNFCATRAATRIQKSPKSSPLLSQGIKKQADAPTTVWPKPREIPYQAKVANVVNLIGNVKVPVQFDCDSDGKHFTTIVISLGNKNSLLIPVVFEGDLAHIVACHVKEGNCVFVTGQLSAEPLRSVPIENLGKLHVVAENLNFVEGFEKDYKLDKGSSAENFPKPLLNVDPLPKSATLELGNVGWSAGKKNDADPLPKSATLELGNVGWSVGKKNDADPLPKSASLELGNVGWSVGKKNDADQIGGLWRDLVKNPLEWYDYRQHKTNGLVKDTYPDFKHKGSGEALWLSSAPIWVLPGLGKLEFDVKDLKPKQVEGGVNLSAKNRNVRLEESWKSLVENPSKWWDNRANKKNPKAPDFKHKDTGEALWLNTSPAWALSKLPPLESGLPKEDAW